MTTKTTSAATPDAAESLKRSSLLGLLVHTLSEDELLKLASTLKLVVEGLSSNQVALDLLDCELFHVDIGLIRSASLKVSEVCHIVGCGAALTVVMAGYTRQELLKMADDNGIVYGDFRYAKLVLASILLCSGKWLLEVVFTTTGDLPQTLTRRCQIRIE